MKCPDCGKEMTAGMIQSSSLVFFTTQRHSLFFRPFYPTAKSDGVTMLHRNYLGVADTTPAWCCHECKKALIDYSQVK